MIQMQNEEDGRRAGRVYQVSQNKEEQQARHRRRQWQSMTRRANWPAEGSGSSPSRWDEPQTEAALSTKRSTQLASDKTLAEKLTEKKGRAASGSLVDVITKPIRLIQMNDLRSSRSRSRSTPLRQRDASCHTQLLARTTPTTTTTTTRSTTLTTCCKMSANRHRPTGANLLGLAAAIVGSYCLLLACAILANGAPLNMEPQVVVSAASQQQQQQQRRQLASKVDSNNNNDLVARSGRAGTVFGGGVLGEGRAAQRQPVFISEQSKRGEDISLLRSGALPAATTTAHLRHYDNRRRHGSTSDQELNSVADSAASYGNVNEDDGEELEQLLLLLASELAAEQPPRNRRLNKRSGISDQRLAEIQMIRALKKQLERAASKIAGDSASGGGQNGGASAATEEQAASS